MSDWIDGLKDVFNNGTKRQKLVAMLLAVVMLPVIVSKLIWPEHEQHRIIVKREVEE